MNKLFFKVSSLMLVMLIVVSSFFTSITASATSTGSAQASAVEEGLEKYYWDLLSEYEEAGYTDYDGEKINFSLHSVNFEGETPTFSEKQGKTALIWKETIEKLSWQVSVPEDALYSIEVDFLAVNEKATDMQRSMLLDGVLPCMEWNNLVFTRLFNDLDKKRVDVNGDESAPNMEQVFKWQTNVLSDYSGYVSGPMKLYLTKGTHTFTFLMNGNQPMAIGSISLVSPENLLPYKEIEKQYKENGYTPSKKAYEIEAEDTLYRSSSSLRLVADKDLSCSPSSVKNDLINSVGGSYWKSSRQAITWELDAPSDGLYQLAFDFYSYYNYGCPVYRRILIDGKVPFAEMAEYCFLPSTKWRTEALSDKKGNPYSFYLTKGKHTLTMSIVAGDMTEIGEILTKDMEVLSALYLDITLITSSDPDPNYDYNLSDKIPHLMDTMQSLHDNLGRCAEILKKVTGNDKALNYSQIQNTMDDLHILMEDEYEIPSNISQFTTLLTNYGNWISQIKAGTMTIDKVILAPSNAALKHEKAPWYKKIGDFFMSFLGTFTKDYNSVIGDGKLDNSKPTIDVWFGGTQIWANEIQDIIEADFVEDTGIQVKFKLTPEAQITTGVNAMLLALISGNAPDVVISAPNIADYAMRNQVYDLKQFTDFNEVAKLFPEVCFTPLTYHNKVYGLPITMDFQMMFYRNDIFKEIGIEVPKTWDDMIDKVIPKLAENSMHLSASPGHQILLFQRGGDLYNADMTESMVASQVSWEAFKMHCDFYNMYGVPKAADFFNRFRSGECPVGFGTLVNYIQFTYAAPELVGRWSVAPMPGTVQADGSVNRCIGGLLGQAAMIMADAKHPNEGWKFLKWYTNANTQVAISERMEAKLDMSARLISANVEAFEALDWDRDDLKVFRKAMEQTKAYNPVLGSYYTDRYLTLASNAVVISKTMTEREALEYAQENINNELERRRNGLS